MHLQNLINESILLLKLQNKASNLLLKEENNNKITELQEVTVNEIPANTFVFSLDKKIEVRNEENNKSVKRNLRNEFFNFLQELPINKGADAIFISLKNNELFILVCEMKSAPEGYTTQLVNSCLFVKYLIELFNTFYSRDKVEIKQLACVLFHVHISDKIIDKQEISRRDIKQLNKYTPQKVYKRESLVNHNFEVIKVPFENHKWNYISWNNLINMH
jgi:hypothetical protein